MNPKNALIMVAAVLLIVVNLFEGDTAIPSVASGDPEEIAQIIESGGEVLEQAATSSQHQPVGRARQSNSEPVQTFADEEPAAFEEPVIEEYQPPSDDEESAEVQSPLSPEDMSGEPFDPRIR